jgi:hypothetical protein
MTDHDDKVSRSYQALGKEEPPASLDQAILASARRAVAPKPVSQRWAVPVSLAAVLVLAVGVTLNMQHEKPGIETSAPMNEYSLPPAASDTTPAVPAPATPAPQTITSPVVTAPPSAQKQKLEASRSRRDVGEAPAPRAEKKDEFRAAETAPSPPPQPQPKAFTDSVAPVPPPPSAPAEPMMRAPPPAANTVAPATVAPAPTQMPASPAASAPSVSAPAPALAKRQSAPAAPAAAGRPAPLDFQASQAREKRETLGASADAAKEVEVDAHVRELERIARLRKDGRHAEADAALEKFRRENPAYKIPDALWEQVKAR